jgi:hypothetical protein
MESQPGPAKPLFSAFLALLKRLHGYMRKTLRHAESASKEAKCRSV